jgi:hypothetical protein
MMIIAFFKIVATSSCESNFFGLIPWYHYLPSTDIQSCNVMIPTNGPPTAIFNNIPLILLAVIDDLLRLAGIVAVGFVVYGGFQYVASQGQADKTARAQNTITDALIGLAIAIAAIAIVTLIGNKLSGV